MAVAAAALVAAFVAAAPVVFLGSVSAGAVARQLDPLCAGRLVAPGLEREGAPTALGYRVDVPALAAAAERVGGFEAPVVSRIGGRLPDGTPVTAVAGGATAPVQLGTRTGWDQQVPGDATPDDDRIWLPATAADQLGVVAGDRVTLVGTAGEVDLEVGGVVPDVVGQADSQFWCPLGPQLGSNVFFFASVAPAPMAIVSEAAYEPLLASLGARDDWQRWEVPLSAVPGTLAEARRAVERIEALEDEAVGTITRGDDVGRSARPVPGVPDNVLTSQTRLPFVTDRAGAITDAVRATITPMALLSAAVALGLVGGVGVVWVDRRRTQVRLLWVRGVAPAWIGVKAGLEAALPVAAGAAAGWGLAVLAGRFAGPSAVLESGAVRRALAVAALAAVATLATILVTVAVTVRGGAHARAGRRRWAWIPWEVPVLLAAWWSLDRLRSSGAPVVEGDRLPPVDTLALLFPLLLLVGVGGVAVRLLGLALRGSRRVGGRWPTAAYLAVRRLAGEGRTVVVLTALLTLSAGVVTFGAGLVRSSEATADAKGGVRLGTDVAARTGTGGEVPASLANRASFVLSRDDLSYGDGDADVQAVDPASFAQAAYWDDSFASESLAALLEQLETHTGDRVPALLAGRPAPGSGRLSVARRPDIGIDVEVVATVPVWPGLRTGRTLLVVSQDDAGPLGERLAVELWARQATEAEVRSALVEQGQAVLFVVSRERLVDTSAYLPTVWTFGFVQALGAVVGALALVGLLAYAEARQRARAVAYAMARRMGLTAAGHRRALLAELGALALLAAVVGTVTGWMAVRAVNELLDAQPERPPPALLRLPWDTLGLLVVTASAAVVAVAVLAQRIAGRADPAEVLRGDA